MPRARTVPDDDDRESRELRRHLKRSARLHRDEKDFRPMIDCNEPDFEEQRFMTYPETLDELPGEGETKTTTYVRTRRCCDNCGEPAHMKHTFLLENARRNPASSAYGMDDCSYCEDSYLFACKACGEELRHSPPRGQSWCGTFFAVAGRHHIFLHWEEVKPQS